MKRLCENIRWLSFCCYFQLHDIILCTHSEKCQQYAILACSKFEILKKKKKFECTLDQFIQNNWKPVLLNEYEYIVNTSGYYYQNCQVILWFLNCNNNWYHFDEYMKICKCHKIQTHFTSLSTQNNRNGYAFSRHKISVDMYLMCLRATRFDWDNW